MGCPEGFDPAASDGLGLQIVRTLVTSELGGSLYMPPPPARATGTEAVLTLPGSRTPAPLNARQPRGRPGKSRTGLEAVVVRSCGRRRA